MDQRTAMEYIVCLVVVLRVIFEYLGFLLVLECPRQIICTKVLPPFLTVHEPVNFKE